MEARIRDLELELEEEKRRHAETIKILRKKERTVKEVLIQCEEDQKNVIILQESLEKATAKIQVYKRQLSEQVRHLRPTRSAQQQIHNFFESQSRLQLFFRRALLNNL